MATDFAPNAVTVLSPQTAAEMLAAAAAAAGCAPPQPVGPAVLTLAAEDALTLLGYCAGALARDARLRARVPLLPTAAAAHFGFLGTLHYQTEDTSEMAEVLPGLRPHLLAPGVAETLAQHPNLRGALDLRLVTHLTDELLQKGRPPCAAALQRGRAAPWDPTESPELATWLVNVWRLVHRTCGRGPGAARYALQEVKLPLIPVCAQRQKGKARPPGSGATRALHPPTQRNTVLFDVEAELQEFLVDLGLSLPPALVYPSGRPSQSPAPLSLPPSIDRTINQL